MPEDTGWVVIPLPERISSANAEQVRERLLWVINRGTAVLVADLTATASCDSFGAGALLQAYQRGVATGTELRLVVTAETVRHALRLSGLSHLALMFPTPAAALADLREGRQPPQVPKTATAVALDPGRVPAAGAALLASAVDSIFSVALSLRDATGQPHDQIVRRITESLDKLDDAIGHIREHVFAEHSQECQLPTAAGQPPGLSEWRARTAARTAALRRQLAETAGALHTASAETAALMAQRRGLVEEPHRVDYPTQIKRWEAIADAAERMAERWKDD